MQRGPGGARGARSRHRGRGGEAPTAGSLGGNMQRKMKAAKDKEDSFLTEDQRAMLEKAIADKRREDELRSDSDQSPAGKKTPGCIALHSSKYTDTCIDKQLRQMRPQSPAFSTLTRGKQEVV